MKKTKLILASLAVLGAGFLATSSNVHAAEQSNTGFAHKDGKVYYVENGQITKGWKSINAKSEDSKEGTHKVWIYVSQTGEVQTGWVQDNGSWYYLSELTGEQKGIGLMQKGFLEVSGKWYYFDESGAMKENQWFQVGNKWYVASGKGTILTNVFITYQDEVYHFNTSGEMAANEWFEVNGGWFYASKSGAILRNTTTPDGYYVNANGIAQ